MNYFFSESTKLYEFPCLEEKKREIPGKSIKWFLLFGGQNLSSRRFGKFLLFEKSLLLLTMKFMLLRSLLSIIFGFNGSKKPKRYFSTFKSKKNLI